LGHPQFPLPRGSRQGPAAPGRHFRYRDCLLKGCEQRFRPVHPQSRYCSDQCGREAQRWRCLRASRTWRASELGQMRRREQARRYRRRIPLVVLPESFFTAGPAEPELSPVTPPLPAPAAVPEVRAGQRPGSKSNDFSWRWCARPGCYVVFPVRSAFLPQRFCSGVCRRALRNVLDREAHYRQRRRDGDRPVHRRSRPAAERPP